MATMTYDEAQQLEIARQLELARMGLIPPTEEIRTTPGLIPTRRSMLDLSPPSEGQIVGGGIPMRGGGLNLIPQGEYNPRFADIPTGRSIGGARSDGDRGGSAVVPPNGPVVSDGDKLLSLLATLGRGQSGGGGGGIRPAVSNAAINAATLANSQLSGEIDTKQRGNQDRVLEASRLMQAPTTVDRSAIWDRLQAESPMPKDESKLARIVAHLPFMVNGKMDFSGARDHSLRFNEADFSQKRDALNRRDAELSRRMGFSEAETAQLEKIRQFENDRKMQEAQLQADPLEGAKAKLGFIPQLMTAQTHLDTTNAQIAAHAREGAANRAANDPTAQLAMKVKVLSGIEKLGLDPSSPVVRSIMHAMGGGTVKPEIAHVDQIKLAQEGFSAQAAPYLKDVKDGAILSSQLAARLGTAIQGGADPAMATRAILSELANRYPLRK